MLDGQTHYWSNTDYYQRFLDSMRTSIATQQKYKTELQYYLRDIGEKNANSLISEDLADSPSKIRQIEDRLIEYIAFLQDKGYSTATIQVRLAAVFHFYTINRINLNKKYVSKFCGKRRKVMSDTAYTHSQIEIMLSTSSDLRQKVIVLLLASTGMRVGAIHSLVLSNLRRVDVGTQYLYKVIVYELEEEEYYTFCSFECAMVIDQYLEYRKRFGEILKPNSPLIREEFDHNDLFKSRMPRKLSNQYMMILVDRILVAAGIKTVKRKIEGAKPELHPVKRCHGFRKFYVTNMKKANADFSDREFLVGHKYFRGLDVNYDRTTEDDRLQEYLKAMDLLTISPENRLRKQVAEQGYTIQHKLAEKNKQIEEMMRKQEQFEQLIQSLIDSGQLKPVVKP
jgi:integrase